MKRDETLESRWLDELAGRQLPSGGWAACASSRQAGLEPSCLAALALRSRPNTCKGAYDFLLRVQNPNGSWPAFDGDDHDGAWVTSLAVIALEDYVPAITARQKGLEWLVRCAGKESSWIWKWKFRTSDRHVRFDPDKYGWPWFPGTVSWVVPTSFAILALRQVPHRSGGLKSAPSRLERGIEMLLDRACPAGGWNAGNGVVYGAPLWPHADDTSIALLALTAKADDRLTQGALLWLEHTARELRGPWSLSWAVLALAAHGRPAESLLNRLQSLLAASAGEDTGTLAVFCFALDYRNALRRLGVSP